MSMQTSNIHDCRLYYKDDDNNYIPITEIKEIKEVVITESEDVEAVDITPYKKFNSFDSVSFTLEMTPEAADRLFSILGSEILNYQLTKISNAMAISAKQLACILEDFEYECKEEHWERELDYDTKLKKYDKFTKTQAKQFMSPTYHSKNYPYRRCDRSR